MPPPPRAVLRVLSVLAALALPLAGSGPASATNDQYWDRQWAPVKIGLPSAWEISTGAGIRIGLIDSGVDLAHQDLQGKVVANASCISTSGNPAGCVSGGGQDVNGHGTHVAGIAAAIKDNGVGVAGTAPSAQLVVARVFQGDTADLADVEAAIRWTVDQGAKVVNLSLGENVLLGGLLGGGGSLGPALNDAWARGAVPVVAVGNAQLLGGSAGYGNINALVVGGTGPEDQIASYSVPLGNAKWAIVAPGGDGAESRQIFSTYWRAGSANQYGYLQGTSMATPAVSGTIALLLARGLTPQRAVEVVLATANRSVSCGATCAGRLDAGAALAATGAAPATTTTTTATTSPPAPPTTAAPSTAAPRRPTAATTAPATTVPATAPPPPPAETTTVAPPPSTEVTAPPPEEPDESLQAAAARKAEDDEDVVVPGVAAGVLLAGVAAGGLVARRRTS